MNYSIINKFNDINIKAWNHLLSRSDFSNVFHTQKAFNFFKSIENCSPSIFACLNEEKEIKVLLLVVFLKEKGLIKGFFSRRAIIFGGPVIDDKDPKLDFFLKETIKYVTKVINNKAIYLEIRNLNNYSKYKQNFEDEQWNYSPHLNFKVACNNIDVYKNISKSKKRQINKSLNSGAKIIEASNEEQVVDFYQILKKLYLNKIKKPLMPKSFFLNFYRQKIGKYLLIEYKNKIIGGIMCPIFNNDVIYEWYIAGEDRVYKDIYPSVLATWAAIDYANKNNIEYFDFMGAGKPDQDYGVREFKSKFGGELVEFGRFVKILNPMLYNFGKLSLKILSKINK